MLVRTELLERVGPLNEIFFLYCEELDLAVRAKQLGFDTGWARDSVVYHEGGVSTGSRTSTNESGSDLAAYHENLSALRYTRLHHRHALPVAMTARLLFKCASIAYRRSWNEYRPMFRAYRDFVFGRPTQPQSTGAFDEPRVTTYE